MQRPVPALCGSVVKRIRAPQTFRGWIVVGVTKDSQVAIQKTWIDHRGSTETAGVWDFTSAVLALCTRPRGRPAP